jgi:hypothetical protein
LEGTGARANDPPRPRPGVYVLARDTVGAKAHWTRRAGERTFHLYGIAVPHNGWAIGTDLQSHILVIESYEARPGWGTHVWKEECAADGGAQQVSGPRAAAAASRHRRPPPPPPVGPASRRRRRPLPPASAGGRRADSTARRTARSRSAPASPTATARRR